MKAIHSHCLCYTFATHCFELDIPLKILQSLFGHSSIQMTMDLYTYISELKKQKNMQKIEELFQLGKPKTISIKGTEKFTNHFI